MKYLKSISLNEGKNEESPEAAEFTKKFGTELIGDFTKDQIDLLDEAFSQFDPGFIKNKIEKIELKDMGAVHGKWIQRENKKMVLNPKDFELKKILHSGDKSVPYRLFIIVHEIGHCIDHFERISFRPEWKKISEWKKLDRDKKVPEGFTRYVEKRKGREAAGPPKSNWIHKTKTDFTRRYSSRSPREDFADSFAFAVFGFWDKFKGEAGKEKMEMVKEVIRKVK